MHETSNGRNALMRPTRSSTRSTRASSPSRRRSTSSNRAFVEHVPMPSVAPTAAKERRRSLRHRPRLYLVVSKGSKVRMGGGQPGNGN